MTDWRSPVTKPLLAFGTPKPAGDRSTFRVTSPFGWRDDPLNPGTRVFHEGLDLGDFGSGADVVAAAAGTIEAVGFLREPHSTSSTRWASGNYGGWMVVLAHSNGYRSKYAHLIPLSSPVRRGQTVKAGALLGKVGDSGSAQGAPHLHFGIQLSGRDIDPWPLITEDAMPVFGADELKVVSGAPTYTVTAAANFRAEPHTGAKSLRVLAAGQVLRSAFMVVGESVGGNDLWIPSFKWVDGRFREGFLHSSAAQRNPDPVTADCSVQDAKLAKVREALPVIEQAVVAARTVVG